MTRNVMAAVAASLATGLFAPGAHAVHLELVGLGDSFDMVLASAQVAGQAHDLVLSGALTDTSSARERAMAGAGGATLPGGSVADGAEVSWDGGLFGGEAPNGKGYISTYTSASLTAQGPRPLASEGAAVSSEMALLNMQWRIVGDEGEPLGSHVKLHFDGLAEMFAVSDIDQVTPDAGSVSGLEMKIGDTTVLNVLMYQGQQPLQLSYDARAGDLVTVSAFTRVMLDSAAGVALLAGQGYGGAAAVSGTLSVTSAVPEPTSGVLALVGVLWVGVAARRRVRNRPAAVPVGS